LLDQENQSKLTDERIQKWTNQLELEFSWLNLVLFNTFVAQKANKRLTDFHA
jgi:hypothetical protein